MLVAACSSIATIVPLLAKTRCRVDLDGEARLMLAVNCVRVLLERFSIVIVFSLLKVLRGTRVKNLFERACAQVRRLKSLFLLLVEVK